VNHYGLRLVFAHGYLCLDDQCDDVGGDRHERGRAVDVEREGSFTAFGPDDFSNPGRYEYRALEENRADAQAQIS
jgi:hypothetical protein